MKLKRVKQCKACPWKVSTNPHDIPDGYDVERHRALKDTIATPGAFDPLGTTMRVMACHEHDSAEGVHCVGWLANQLGPGNNIPLRLAMRGCENIRYLQTVGEQHERFEDTLPENKGY